MSKAATIKNNRGSITFQLSSKYTKRYYPERKGSKYIYFGLPHSDDNELLARIKLKKLILDLENGSFDPFNEAKYKHVETLENIIEKRKLPTLKEIATMEWESKLKMGIIYKSSLKAFVSYKKFLDKVPEDITDVKALEEMIESYPITIHRKRTMLQLVIATIRWGIKEEKLPDCINNVLKKIVRLEEMYVLITNKTKTCRKNKLGNIEKEFAYYSEDERDVIIEAFYNRESNLKKKRNNQANVAELVEFIFCTGVRTQEAFALTWADISEKNEDIIVSINKAYASNIRELKGTKTGKIREFKVNDRVKKLIARMRQNSQIDKDGLLFKYSKGIFHSNRLNHYWYGHEKSKTQFYPGVVTSLYQEGKISKYLNANQMRASFITHQLLKGKSPLIISKWTGHDAKTLLEYYEKLTGMEESPAD